jgi:hypothetical protein
MPRRFQSPNLHKAKVRVLDFLGKGQDPNYTSEVCRAEVVEKTHDGKLVFQSVRKHRPHESRNHIAHHQSIYRTLRKLKLPVPKFSRTMLEQLGDHKKTVIIAEDLTKRYGKLEDCHKLGNPVFLKKLRLNKDRKLITNLAKDLATMHLAGIVPKYIDFWHFYQVGNWNLFGRGSWDRVIVDFDKMYRIPKKQITHDKFIGDTLRSTSQNMNVKVWQAFHKIYLKETGQLI